MKKLFFLVLTLMVVLTSCEHDSGKKDEFNLENSDVILTNGYGQTVILPIQKTFGATIMFNANTPEIKELIIAASAKTNLSCKYTFAYEPTAVYVEIDKFRDTVVTLRFTTYNNKGKEISSVSKTVFSGFEIYEFEIREIKR